MYPILLSTKWFNVYSYGFFIAIGYTVIIILTCYKAKKNGLNVETIFDLMLMQLVVAIIGSRLLFVWEYIPEKLYTIDLLDLESGGLTFYGAIIASFIFDFVYLKIRKIPFWKTIDCIAFGLGPGVCFVRIGCFLNGCCYGTPCSPLIGFQFKHLGTGYYHATQLYESFLALVAFIIMLKVSKKYITHYGQYFLGFVSLYGFFRFFIEFLRAENPVFMFGMTLSQVLSIIFIILSIFVWKMIIKNKELEIMPDMNEHSLKGKK